VQRYLAAYRSGGLDGLRHWGVIGPVSELARHAEVIKASLSETPVRTVAEAADRIEQLTGISRRLTQTRVFLKDIGFHWQRTRAVPVPPKSL
jgi:transposase